MRSAPRPKNVVATSIRFALRARSAGVTLATVIAKQPERAVRVISAVPTALAAVGVRMPVLVQRLRTGRALRLAHIVHDLAGAVGQVVQIGSSWNVIALVKFGVWACKRHLSLCRCFRLAICTGVVVATVHIGDACAVWGG